MKKFMRTLLLAVCVLALICGSAAAAEGPQISCNIGGIYDGYNKQWVKPVRSFLYGEGEDLVRVESLEDAVTVERYSAEFEHLSTKILEMELPIWGGFYAGESYNFLIFGQRNMGEDDSREVIRVVRYSKDWQRIDHASLCGANTTIPFNGGAVSITEYNGFLYVRTCHEMYRNKEDGLIHQKNLTFSLRQENMDVTEVQSDVLTNSRGYVSHSFNQHVLVDSEGRLVTLDHGDAYPRAAYLFRYFEPAGTEGTLSNRGIGIEVTQFPGMAGNNYTGAYVTGLAETSTGYLSLYTTLWEGDEQCDSMDLYLAYTPKDSFGETVKHMVAEDCGEGQIIPTGAEGGYILWQDDRGTAMYYAAYSSDGTVGETVEIRAERSDCQPIFWKDQIVWYVTDGGEPVFYTLDVEDLEDVGPEDKEEDKEETEPSVSFFMDSGRLYAQWEPAVDNAASYRLMAAQETGDWETLCYSEDSANYGSVINATIPVGLYTRFRVDVLGIRDQVVGSFEVHGSELTITESRVSLCTSKLNVVAGVTYLRFDGLKPMAPVVGIVTGGGFSGRWKECSVDSDGGKTYLIQSVYLNGDGAFSLWQFTELQADGVKASMHREILADNRPLLNRFSLKGVIAGAEHRCTEVKIQKGEETVWQTAEALGGMLQLDDLEPGSYTLEVRQEGALTYKITDIIVDNKDVDIGTIHLLTGDVDGNGLINARDINGFRREFGKSGADIGNIAADLNGDDKVNTRDINVLRKNFGKSAAKDCTVVFPA